MRYALDKISKIKMAENTIAKLGDTFTKKEYEAIKPRKSATIEWLEWNELISVDHEETFEKEVNSYGRYGYARREAVRVLADGRTLCTECEWANLPLTVKGTITMANKGEPITELREPKETITCKRYFWKWNAERANYLIEECMEEALEFAEKKLVELEPKVLKYKMILETYAEE